MRKMLPTFLILMLVFFILITGSCTIRKIDEADAGKTTDMYSTWTKSGKEFDPVAYVDSIWEEQLIPAFQCESFLYQDVYAALEEDSEEAIKLFGLERKSGEPTPVYKVRGTGVVLEYDDSSRNGLLRVDLLPADGESDVVLQVGPVIRKTAIRDSVDFISFTDVGNQLQFASLSDELNARMRRETVDPLDLENIAGKTIDFYGAFIFEEAQDVDAIVVTPVIIDVISTQGD
jgi:predicted lipoprotein